MPPQQLASAPYEHGHDALQYEDSFLAIAYLAPPFSRGDDDGNDDLPLLTYRDSSHAIPESRLGDVKTTSLYTVVVSLGSDSAIHVGSQGVYLPMPA